MLRRIIGLDMEYGCAMDDNDPVEAAQYILKKSLWANDYLPNGGRLYIDCGHIEIATPECLDPYEAARYHLGGDHYLNRLRQGCEKEGRSISIYRDSMDCEHNTFGCHESYLTLRRVNWTSGLSANLIPFLISRIIFTGSGFVDLGGKFHLSPRAMVLDAVQAQSATEGSRSILNKRDEPLMIGDLCDKYRRLHLTIGDANVSQLANVLKLGTTSLVLSMIEAGYDFSPLYPTEPIAAIQSLNNDICLRAKINTRSGKTLSALDIQRHYCRQAEIFIDRARRHHDLPDWIPSVHHLWTRTLDDLASYRANSESRSMWSIDWIAKLNLMRIWLQAEPHTSTYTLASIAMDYHNIDPNKSLANCLTERHRAAESYFDREMLGSTSSAPSSFTRAQERAIAVMGLWRKDRRICWEGQWYGQNLIPFNFPDIFETH